MSSNSHDTIMHTSVREGDAPAVWEVLRQHSLEAAAQRLLVHMLAGDDQAVHVFLAIQTGPSAAPRYWCVDKAGKPVADMAYLLSHQPMQKALSEASLFSVNGLFEAGGKAFGPELFLSRPMGESMWVAASVRRSLGAPMFSDARMARLQQLFQGLSLALERLVLTLPVEDAMPGVGLPDEADYHGLTCLSPAMLALVETMEKIKDTDFNVCIFGESGSGKDQVARALHATSQRNAQPFVAEACGAVNESLLESELFGHVKGAFTGAEEDKSGLFAMAHDGTLYLDEISDMPLAMQSKLLRVIQEGEVRPVGANKTRQVNVRIISSTHKNIEQCIASGQFRPDLYWRLNVIAFKVPSLRERQADLPVLIECFGNDLRKEGIRVRPFSKSAVQFIETYHWPGNVRQLQTVIRRVNMMAEGREIGKKEVMAQVKSDGISPWQGEGMVRDKTGTTITIPSKGTFKELIRECERAILDNALTEHNWNKSKVTRMLKIPRQSLYNKIDAFGLTPPETRDLPQETVE